MPAITKTKAPIERINYTDLELRFRDRIVRELEKAKEQRDEVHAELDDMTLVEYWESNAKAGNAYIPEKTDEQDIRTTSGVTLEKKNTLLSNMLNMNLEPEIIAFNEQNLEISELGTSLQDLVKKSRELDEYERRKLNLYNEFLIQGSVGWFERYNEYRIPGKRVDDDFDVSDEATMRYKDAIDKMYRNCSGDIVSSINLYPGNIREQELGRQPFISIRSIKTYEEMSGKYGSWARWKYVPKNYDEFSSKSESTDDVAYNNWTLEEYREGFVEELFYFNKWTNDFMIVLNGVLMLPVSNKGAFPLSGLLGECEYPLAWAVAEPITNFFYGKSIPSKTKVDQALFDEMLKSMVIKTRKSYMPPLANNTGQTLSKRVLWAAHIEDDIDAELLKPIGDNNGVTPAEFNMTKFLKEIIDNKTVDPIMEGQAGRGERTAFEISEVKKQSLISMGLSIMGVISLEKQMAKLRVLNIVKNWTLPEVTTIKGNIYRTFAVDSSFEDGSAGTREIRFTESTPDDTQIYAEEELQKMVTGHALRITYLNPKMLRSLRMNLKIEINPTPKMSSELKQAMYEQSLLKAIQVFLPLGVMPNMEYHKRRWALHQNEDPAQYWASGPGPQSLGILPSQLSSGQGGNQNLGNKMRPNTPAPIATPNMSNSRENRSQIGAGFNGLVRG